MPPTIPQTPKRWSAEDAALVLDAFSRSGLGLTAFARRHGLCVQRLRRWRSRLAVDARPAEPAGSALRLVELVPQATVPLETPAVGRVLVRYPTGHTIELLDLNADQGLTLALRALHELAC